MSKVPTPVLIFKGDSPIHLFRFCVTHSPCYMPCLHLISFHFPNIFSSASVFLEGSNAFLIQPSSVNISHLVDLISNIIHHLGGIILASSFLHNILYIILLSLRTFYYNICVYVFGLLQVLFTLSFSMPHYLTISFMRTGTKSF